jgi:hypothetical protein
MQKLIGLFVGATLFFSCNKPERIINEVKDKLEGTWAVDNFSSGVYTETFVNCNDINFCPATRTWQNFDINGNIVYDTTWNYSYSIEYVDTGNGTELLRLYDNYTYDIVTLTDTKLHLAPIGNLGYVVINGTTELSFTKQ